MGKILDGPIVAGCRNTSSQRQWPVSHCYQNHAGAFSWDRIVVGEDNFDERQKKNKTGKSHFEYNVCSSEQRGRAVVGLFLQQSNVGFIHDPLRRDDAEKITGMDHAQFAKFVMSYGQPLMQATASGKNA